MDDWYKDGWEDVWSDNPNWDDFFGRKYMSNEEEFYRKNKKRYHFDKHSKTRWEEDKPSTEIYNPQYTMTAEEERAWKEREKALDQLVELGQEMGEYDVDETGALYDEVSNPKHYQLCKGVEAKDIIRAVVSRDTLWDHLDNWRIICISHALKYLLRVGQKGDPMKDYRKALQWLQMGEQNEN